MLGNRSFDHMLGYLYTDTGSVSPPGQPFEELTGSMRGFTKDFAYTITWETSGKWPIVPGTTTSWIMAASPRRRRSITPVLKTIKQR